MASFKKIVLNLFVVLSLFVLLKLILEHYFQRYDFNSKNILGGSTQDIIEVYRKYNPNLDIKSILALHFGYLTIINEETKKLTKLILADGSRITKKQVEYALKKITIFVKHKDHHKYDIARKDSIKYFLTFPTKRVGNKNVFKVTKKEKKFIKDNESVIKQIGRNAEIFFKEDTVKYLTDKNFYISESDNSAVSSVDLNAARYAQFILT
ncbi:hypothetical protein P3W45_001645 [Vairimorpha bombi]|jgi:hypothetical protein